MSASSNPRVKGDIKAYCLVFESLHSLLFYLHPFRAMKKLSPRVQVLVMESFEPSVDLSNFPSTLRLID